MKNLRVEKLKKNVVGKVFTIFLSALNSTKFFLQKVRSKASLIGVFCCLCVFSLLMMMLLYYYYIKNKK